jgi:tRNA pseudouridine13 synthase
MDIEKTDLSTFEALERLGAALACEPREFGFAGMKDRKGITRQRVSIQGVDPERALAVKVPKIRVLDAKRHRNKLRIGHLRGNRFHIVVREVDPDAAVAERVESVLARIREVGMPNYYGPQRFGVRGEAQTIGRCLMRGDSRGAVYDILGRPYESERNPQIVAARYLFLQYRWYEALRLLPGSYRDEKRMLQYLLDHGPDWDGAIRGLRGNVFRLYLTAYQAYLFNLVLEARMRAVGGELGRFFDGDIAFLHRNGACFIVDDVASLAERSANFEISPSGPMFGSQMLRPPRGLAAQIEAEIVAREKLTDQDLDRLEGFHLTGGRRPLRVCPEDIEWSLEGSDLTLRFSLPRGCYATTLLRELMKNDEAPNGLLA